MRSDRLGRRRVPVSWAISQPIRNERGRPSWWRRGKSLEQELPRLFWLFLGVVLAPVAGSAGAHPAIHCRSLASRRRTSLLVPPLATSGKTTHRFNSVGI